ncbi:MAG: glycine cleavage system protein GcvH [Clostridia bacterium]
MKYLSSHEWLKQNGNLAKIGISAFAAEELGDIVFVDLPEVGDEVIANETFAEIESVKAVSEVNSPVSGTVVAVNEAVVDSPESVNEDALEAWFIEVEVTEVSDKLLTEDEYQASIE